jgi:IS30 family transposase
MSNQLSMDTVQAIHALRAQDWSLRKIARELGIHRSTVAAHLASKPAKVPTGSEGSKPAKVPTGSPRRNPRRKTAQKVSKPNAQRIRKPRLRLEPMEASIR